MYELPLPEKRHQSLRALAVSSGLLSNAHELGRPATAGDDPLEHVDGAVGVDPPLDLNRERFAGVLVDDVQELQDAAVCGRVELEVERPHLIWPLRAQPARRCRRLAEPLPLALARRHPQTLFTPQTGSHATSHKTLARGDTPSSINGEGK